MTKGFEEINLEEKEGLKIVSLKFNDVLDREDYELFVPQLERLFEDKDKVRFLVELEDFKGLTLGALWDALIATGVGRWGLIDRDRNAGRRGDIDVIRHGELEA